jgi:hypothetical protein
MKRNACLVFMILLLVGSLAAVPFTTLGNMKVPTAYSLPHKMVEFSMVNYFTPDANQDYRYDIAAAINGGIYDRLTVGLVYNTSKIVYGNLKCQLIFETEVLPAIAIGVDNLGSPIKEYRDNGKAKEAQKIIEYREDYAEIQDFDDYIQNSFYFVATKATVLRGVPFAPYLETVMHIGMGTRRFYGNTDLSKQLAGFFGGIEFSPSPYFTFFTEMDGYNFNAGCATTIRNFDLRVGAYRLEEMDNNDAKIAVNLVYTLDKYSQIKNAEKRRQFTYGSTFTTRQGKVISRESQQADQNPLLQKLDEIRAKREKSQKELEEIRKILEEK